MTIQFLGIGTRVWPKALAMLTLTGCLEQGLEYAQPEDPSSENVTIDPPELPDGGTWDESEEMALGTKNQALLLPTLPPLAPLVPLLPPVLLIPPLPPLAPLIPVPPSLTPPGATQKCTEAQIQAQYAEILAPATEDQKSVHVKCSMRLRAGDKVSKILRFRDARSSDVTFDCSGATLDGGSINGGAIMLQVYSDVEPLVVNGQDYLYYDGNPSYALTGDISASFHAVARKSLNGYYQRSRPTDVTIKNCKVNGRVRVWGLGQNGQDGFMWYSSRDSTSPGHPARARDAAPTRIVFDNVEVNGSGGNPFYIAPGVTYLTLRNSEITGSSTAVSLYLDAESGFNLIENNYIHAATGGNQISIDASSYNTIRGNRFSKLSNGGIFLYRNCGESGVVRYTRPSYNLIENNYFYYKDFKDKPLRHSGTAGPVPAIFLGSRSGRPSYVAQKEYCDEDANSGIPNSSASANRDYAQHNVIQNNVFENLIDRNDIVQSGTSYDSPNTIDLRFGRAPAACPPNEKCSVESVADGGCRCVAIGTYPF